MPKFEKMKQDLSGDYGMQCARNNMVDVCISHCCHSGVMFLFILFQLSIQLGKLIIF